MIIRDSAGRAFDLGETAAIEIERPNIFFSERGEHSLPITLPDSPHNRFLLGFADEPASGGKRAGRYDVSIEDGGFFSPARMVLLSATEGIGYECNFLLSTGSLYDTLRSRRLFDVFADPKYRVEFPSVSSAVSYLESLLPKFPGKDDRFDIFPVRVEGIAVNALKNGGSQFAAREVRIIKKEGETEGIRYPEGFLISPFLRLRFVLSEVFASAGYKVEKWNLFDDAGYSDIVILNNTLDSIVNKRIDIRQLLPDITTGELLDVIRKKFFVEFVPSDTKGTISIISAKFDSDTPEDLSDYVSSPPKLSFLSRFRRIRMSSAEYVKPTNNEKEETDAFEPSTSQSDVASRSEGLSMNEVTGTLYRYWVEGEKEGLSAVTNVYGDYADESDPDLDEFKIDVADCVPATEVCADEYSKEFSGLPILSLGQGRWLNSYLKLSNGKKEKERGESQKSRVMLAIGSRPRGIMSSLYPALGYVSDYPTALDGIVPTFIDGERVNIGYNGSRGLFARRYAGYDYLLRNALRSFEVEVVLPASIARTIDPLSIISIKSQKYVINKIVYTSDPNEPTKLSLFTTRIMHPFSEARNIYLDISRYTWQLVFIKDEQLQYNGDRLPGEEDCDFDIHLTMHHPIARNDNRIKQKLSDAINADDIKSIRPKLEALPRVYVPAPTAIDVNADKAVYNNMVEYSYHKVIRQGGHDYECTLDATIRVYLYLLPRKL